MQDDAFGPGVARDEVEPIAKLLDAQVRFGEEAPPPWQWGIRQRWEVALDEEDDVIGRLSKRAPKVRKKPSDIPVRIEKHPSYEVYPGTATLPAPVVYASQGAPTADSPSDHDAGTAKGRSHLPGERGGERSGPPYGGPKLLSIPRGARPCRRSGVSLRTRVRRAGGTA